MIMQIVGMNWLEIKAGSYKLREENKKVSLVQIEFDCECVTASTIQIWLPFEHD